jgi:ribonuclease Z
MADNELVVLGTASQTPTRERAHHGAFLRFGDETVILDPGEGTQRQLSLAGLSTASLTRICITHAHGDHCLGLPGVLHRMALEGSEQPVDVHFPEHATPYVERLRHAAVYEDRTRIRLRPARPGRVLQASTLVLTAAELSHRIPTLGWRLEEPEGVTMLPERLEALGIHGPDRAELKRSGTLRRGGRTVHLDEVSVPRPGRTVAVVMDTRWCDAALELAADVDLLLVEATFLESEREVAEVAGHLTAAKAARLGVEAGARRIVLTHYSQRYPDLEGHRAEAHAAAPRADVHVARDLDRIPLPPRRTGDDPAWSTRAGT